ncbi:hypothetical protein [Bacillus horti]|uniref:Aminopeptidase n=1 Tax=Caldalkalibacillus horti TaxID=77523 RepID=A0ABT9VXP9_9BACI|nr:hypothetical protein [Bacillus horti]MDQ0165753.1 hypothetical protein [Bacillus horti]
MKIIDTVPFFKENYKPTLQFLRSYYDTYPEIFEEYFAYHCKDTEERHKQSISKYPQYLTTIEEVHRNITPIIHEVTDEYSRIFNVTFPIEVNLIVGGFGSNAFTYRQIIPNITFALEKLSPIPEHLKAIVAHEFGHATHNIISNQTAINWKEIQWTSPLVWLFQEGAATHFSRRTVPQLHESVYFSFNEEGNEWLQFAQLNKADIITEFAKDYTSETPQSLFREWFSINGGKRFGFSRLGYFIGDMFFQSLIRNKSEVKAITAWEKREFLKETKDWLLSN